jgi:hypothetical protein
MPHLIHKARFVLAGIPDPEESAEHLRNEFAASTRPPEAYHLSRSTIAANVDSVTVDFVVREDLATGESPAQEAWSQARAEAALAWLVDRLERSSTWREAHDLARVFGKLTARAGGSAEYQVGG